MVNTHKRFLFLLILSLFCLFLSGYHDLKAATITVKPGKFSHFTVQIPPAPIAGENIVVRLQSYDMYNNLITDFNETGREFEIRVSGSAKAEPKVLSPSNFLGGSAAINIRDKKAETITFSVLETGGNVPILSKEIIIKPNRLDNFVLQTPNQVKAGDTFDVRIVARDSFENMIKDDAGIGKDFRINTTGTGGLKYLDSGALNFKSGVATARFLSGKAGEVIIDVYDPYSGIRGKSSSINILPGAMSALNVQAPKDGIAGNPFEIIITAHDKIGNPVTNYNTTGDGVQLTSTGKGKVYPDRISPSEFKGGNAVVKVTYEVAENIEVVATESNKKESGKSGTVRIRPATPDHFIVVTPETASAGQGFKLRIEAYDRFKNVVRDYNLIGGEVYISITGTGTFTPSTVSPSEFANGIAVVNATYDKAESFSINAKMGPKTEGAREEVKKEKKVEAAKPPAEKKVEPAPAKKVEEKPKPAQPEVKKKPKPEVKPKTEVKKDVEKKPEPKESKKPETKVAKKIETAEAKKAEPKKEIAKKEAVHGPYEVSDIGIIESKKRAILMVTSNGPVDHKSSLVTKEGKKWLNLKVTPAVRKMEKIQRLKSSFVGDVIIEEEGSTISIMFEILPENVTYESKRSKNSIVVTFTLQ
ncbi:MAG: hypothetical protein AABY44_08020 [Nitrospirota bacterium]